MTSLTRERMSVPLIDLARQHEKLAPELRQAFENVLASGQFVLGKHVQQFEQELAEFLGVRHVIGVSSGTDAILISLMAMDIQPGDEVITTPFTFFATAGCIARLGATPVFAEIDPRTFNIQPQAIEGLITDRTRAIIPVHLFGLPADMGELMSLAKRYQLKVVEDGAQAMGARFLDRSVGAFGQVGCFSFYPTKSLPGLGDGGACATNDDELASRIRCLRAHGSDDGFHFPHVGGNFRLDGLQAAMLSVKLPHLEKWIERRRELARRYEHAFEALPIGTPFEPDAKHHVYNQYTIRVRGRQRDALQHHLAACGIGTRVYYGLPLHLQPCFQHLGYRRGMIPEAEHACREVLSLPLFPEMTDAEQDEVVRSVYDFFEAE